MLDQPPVGRWDRNAPVFTTEPLRFRSCRSRAGPLRYHRPLHATPEAGIPFLDEPLVLLAAVAVVFFAAAVQGVTGFGFGLLSIGFLALLLGSHESIMVLTLVGPLVSLLLLVRHRKHVDWRETAWLVVPVVLATAPGLWLFDALEPGPLRRVVGALLVVFTIWYALPVSPRARRLSRVWTIAAGLSGGFLSGLTSTGGPPLVLYLLVLDLGKRRSLSVLQAVFLVSGLVKVAMAGTVGFFTADLAGWALALAVPLVAGVLAGQRLFDRLDAAALRRVSLAVLGIMGVVLLAGL